jgi:hypothetical protein
MLYGPYNIFGCTVLHHYPWFSGGIEHRPQATGAIAAVYTYFRLPKNGDVVIGVFFIEFAHDKCIE